MDRFWSIFDISDNISRGLKAVGTLYGIPAAVLLVALVTINYLAVWPLCWYFDIDSTRVVTAGWATFVIPRLPVQTAGQIGWTIVALGLLPTFFEMFGSRFARFGFVLAGWMVFAAASFDLVTDWPRVREFTAPHLDAFTDWGILQYPCFWIYRAGWLVMGSFGFEAWLAVTTVVCFALVLRVFAAPRRGALVGG